jgi:hypothetical protein
VPRQQVIEKQESEETSLAVYSKALHEKEGSSLTQQREDIAKLIAEISGDEDEEIAPFVIENDDDEVWASNLLLYAKRNKKDLEDKQKRATKHITALLEEVRSWFRAPKQDWGKLETLLKQKIGDYELQKSKKKDEAIAQIAAASREQDYDKAYQASLVLNQESTKIAGVIKTEKWVLDEENVNLEKVPKEFLTIELNRAVVREYIRQFGKGRPEDLPGLPFKKEVGVTGSTKG